MNSQTETQTRSFIARFKAHRQAAESYDPSVQDAANGASPANAP